MRVDANEFERFTYSKRTHFDKLIERYAARLFTETIDPEYCDLKMYQDLLVFAFIEDNLEAGSSILDIGGGDSRILKYYKDIHECWNIDALEGHAAGPTEVDADGFHLVRDYMGNFNRELVDESFDLVFSISALEHVPEDDPQLFARILDDINRVLEPGGYSLHCFDIGVQPELPWTNRLLPFFFDNQSTLNTLVPFETMRGDPDLYTMSRAYYEKYWLEPTGHGYDVYRPLSCNVLWRKGG